MSLVYTCMGVRENYEEEAKFGLCDSIQNMEAGWYVCSLSGKGVMYGHILQIKALYMAVHPKV